MECLAAWAKASIGATDTSYAERECRKEWGRAYNRWLLGDLQSRYLNSVMAYCMPPLAPLRRRTWVDRLLCT